MTYFGPCDITATHVWSKLSTKVEYGRMISHPFLFLFSTPGGVQKLALRVVVSVDLAPAVGG